MDNPETQEAIAAGLADALHKRFKRKYAMKHGLGAARYMFGEDCMIIHISNPIDSHCLELKCSSDTFYLELNHTVLNPLTFKVPLRDFNVENIVNFLDAADDVECSEMYDEENNFFEYAVESAERNLFMLWESHVLSKVI